jgi:hypothetical protein
MREKVSVMINTNKSASLCYAIVETLRSNSGPERFVIAYRTEQSLHEFLVPSAIVASGYRSREEAVRYCEPAALPAAA